MAEQATDNVSCRTYCEINKDRKRVKRMTFTMNMDIEQKSQRIESLYDSDSKEIT